MDLMFVNGMPMFTGIDQSVRFRSLVPIDDRTAETLYKALDQVFRKYNAGGYTVKRIHCDQEFKPLMDPVKDKLDIQMNYTVTDEHVPEAERNNRTIAERIHVAYHNLPYKTMPRLMWKRLAMVCTHQLNLFPAKGGISPYLSPHMSIMKSIANFLLVPMCRQTTKTNQPIPMHRVLLTRSTCDQPKTFRVVTN